MSRCKAEKILEALERSFKINLREFTAASLMREDPFKVLIVTILSQNTTDKNSMKAFKRLEERFEINPETLSEASEVEIREAIKPAGMQNVKSKVIKEVSREVLKRYGGSLSSVLALPLEEARSELLSLSGVGRKTADVILLFSANKPTIPVDTHVMRVSKRIGFADASSSYEDVRSKLMELFPREKYLETHLLLILLGRRYCRARNPSCSDCPIKEHCKHYVDKHP